MHLFIALAEEHKGSRMLSLRTQERFGSPALWPAFGTSAISSGFRSGKSRLASTGWRAQQLRYALQFASAKSCRCTRVAGSGGSGNGLHSWPSPVDGGRLVSVCPTCALKRGGVRMHFAPEAVSNRPRAPEKETSRFGQAGAGVVCRAWPNPPVNLTRNGMRQSAAEVSCAQSSSPAACRTPLRSGYRQR
jgi:hypothetical protein